MLWHVWDKAKAARSSTSRRRMLIDVQCGLLQGTCEGTEEGTVHNNWATVLIEEEDVIN